MFRSGLPSALAILALWTTTTAATGSTCYYLDGSSATHDSVYRCDNSTDVSTSDSACCNVGMTCWSNGVCESDKGSGDVDYLRVGCTDPTWSAPECLDQCVNYVPTSSTGIRPCGGITSNASYCCDPGNDEQYACCDDANNIFQLAIPTVIGIVPATWSSTSTSTSSSSTSASSSSTTSASTTSTSTSTPTSTSTSSATASSSASSSSSSHVGTIVGAAVGIPVGLALIAGLGYLFWRSHSRKKAKQAELNMAAAHGNNSMGENGAYQYSFQGDSTLANSPQSVNASAYHAGHKYAGIQGSELGTDVDNQPPSEVMGDTMYNHHEVPGSMVGHEYQDSVRHELSTPDHRGV